MLGNDGVYDWMVGFLRSFRSHNPTLPLILIAYDDNCRKISRLASRYDFTIAEDPHLTHIDELGRRVGKPGSGGNMFRKYHAFWGEFDAAWYLDSDVVVTGDLAEGLEAFAKSGFDLAYTDRSPGLVYDEPLLSIMKENHDTREINAGSWLVRKCLDFETVRQTAEQALAQNDHRCFTIGEDQPFTNYLFDLAGLSKTHLTELLPDQAQGTWCREGLAPRIDTRGVCRVGNTDRKDHGKKVRLIHYAGELMSPNMAMRRTFIDARFLDASLGERLAFYARDYGLLLRRSARAVKAGCIRRIKNCARRSETAKLVSSGINA